jgi:hypothetical protein
VSNKANNLETKETAKKNRSVDEKEVKGKRSK